MKLATFSFDDGLPGDVALAERLRQLKAPCTFYLCGADFVVSDWRIRKEKTEVYRGHEIGSHTQTHPHLARCTNAETEIEILGGVWSLKEAFKTSIDCFAYPYGESSETAVELLKKGGVRFARAFNVYQGDGVRRVQDRYRIPISLKFYPDWLGQLNGMLRNWQFIHIAGHAWEFKLDALEIGVNRLAGAGFKLVTNREFFEATCP